MDRRRGRSPGTVEHRHSDGRRGVAGAGVDLIEDGSLLPLRARAGHLLHAGLEDLLGRRRGLLSLRLGRGDDGRDHGRLREHRDQRG